MNAREAALAVWFEQLGRPYRWGGNDPSEGFDCSGLVIEGLKSVGLFPRNGDATAGGLLDDVFANRPRLQREQLQPGALVFWMRGNKVGHVEIVWAVLDSGVVLTIGASGGGSRTLTLQDAVQQDAYVKIRPLVEPYHYALDPFE